MDDRSIPSRFIPLPPPKAAPGAAYHRTAPVGKVPATKRNVLALASIVWLVAGCANRSPQLPSLRSVHAGDPSTIDVIEPGTTRLDGVVQPLDRLGFVGGRERVYVGAPGTFERTVTRALAFAKDTGAEGYLRWLEGHASAIIGTASPVEAAGLAPGVVAFAHAPGGCCPGKDMPSFLVAWRHGTSVLFVDARGRSMALDRAVAIADELRSG